MEEIAESATVKQWIVEKQALEVALALDMLEIFNDGGAGLIQKIRALVSLSVSDMEKKRLTSTHTGTVFSNKWESSWKNYAVCTDNGINKWDPDFIITRVPNFRAEHCADWIRIYGEVIEDVVKGTEDTSRTSYQKGGKYHWTKFNLQSTDPLQSQAGRRRNKDFTGYAEMQTESWRLMSGFHDKSVSEAFGKKSGFRFAGLGTWRVMDKDTTGTMDRVFGLSPGATISGTTTDNIYFFDKFGKVGLDPIYQLLPTATIVGGGHHTLLEVALPLSLNKLIDYQVGLYSTLFPNRGALAETPAGVSEIKSLLGKYQNHGTNRLMLVYYANPAVPAGCFLYDVFSDKDKWAPFATASESLMTKFRSLPPWPSRQQVLSLPYR